MKIISKVKIILSRNPYFIGILSAIPYDPHDKGIRRKSQSLFYWNPFCNNIKENDIEIFNESQSLFYWNPFCNDIDDMNKKLLSFSRNPYFIGILSAILVSSNLVSCTIRSQSLFYWNPFCNGGGTTANAEPQIVAILILLESFLQ